MQEPSTFCFQGITSLLGIPGFDVADAHASREPCTPDSYLGNTWKYIRKVDCITSSWFLLSMYGSIWKKSHYKNKNNYIFQCFRWCWCGSNPMGMFWNCGLWRVPNFPRRTRHKGYQRGSMFDDWPLAFLIKENKDKHDTWSRWWFKISVMFTTTWGNDPIWLNFLGWVETTN